jgi:hypothetical protein
MGIFSWFRKKASTLAVAAVVAALSGQQYMTHKLLEQEQRIGATETYLKQFEMYNRHTQMDVNRRVIKAIDLIKMAENAQAKGDTRTALVKYTAALELLESLPLDKYLDELKALQPADKEHQNAHAEAIASFVNVITKVRELMQTVQNSIKEIQR